ncbi:GIP [Symbiodinium natans]|uniref:GIP protein n=1 Tax=Symbiodinium natans TaxID=878477 RepID=A0A812QE88_9DINO|nr:GIP [Symbiodinium natans]
MAAPRLRPPPRDEPDDIFDFIDMPGNNSEDPRADGAGHAVFENGMSGAPRVDLREPGSYGWTPSRPFPSAFPGFPNFPATTAPHNIGARAQGFSGGQFGEGPLWMCRACQSDDCRWDRTRDSWFCVRCGSDQIYDTSQPAVEETRHGTWTYQPRDRNSSASTSPRSSPSSASTWTRPGPRMSRTARLGPPGLPGGEGFDFEAREAAESETLTLDPCVTPSETSEQPGRLSRRQRRAKKQATAKESCKGEKTEDGELDDLQDTAKQLRKLLNKSKSDSDQASWSSLKGPERGVRWRGGTPPAPPKWQYSKDDLRAFSKFERKVGIWQLQVKPYMSEAEAALSLYCSLSGEAEEELEHIDLAKLYAKDGIAFLLEQLRGPLQAKQVYLKRKFLADFETVSRHNGEGMRSYVNRYHRAEKALLSIGINVTLTYDSESRGSRLLDRAKLTLEQQRMVLVGTNQSLHFDEIKNALVLQYPDHKPPPYVQGPPAKDQQQNPRAFPKGKGKGYKGAWSSSTSAPTTSSSSSAAGSARRVWVAEAESGPADEDSEFLDVIPEDGDGEEAEDHNDDEDDGEELVPDGDNDPEGAIQELMQVLTVTSKKLQSMTQGRKYRGAPRKSVEERKRSSSCSACGQIGHWAGDSECAVSAKGKPKGDAGKGSKSNTTSVNDKKGGAGTQKVFSVRHAGGHEVLYAFDPQQQCPQGPDDHPGQVHRSLVVFQSAAFECMTSASEMQGYCVVDTACQRSCCSRKWFDNQQALLQSFGLEAMFTRRCEAFQFGAGAPQRSSTCVYFPVAFEASHPLIALGASILNDLEIPFLASLSLLEKLNVVLDLCNRKAYIGLLDCTVDLFLVQGHLCLKNSEYPADVQFVWEEQDTHDCEFLCDSSKCFVSKLSKDNHEESAARERALNLVQNVGNSPGMACELASHGQGTSADDGASRVYGSSCNKTWAGKASPGKPRRWHGKGHGHQEEAEAGANDCPHALPALEHEAPRQRTGPLHNVRGLPMSMEVGRRRRWCNPWVALSSVIQIACASLAFGRHGPGSLVDSGNSVVPNDFRGVSEDEGAADFGDFSLRVPWNAGRDHSDPRQRQRGDPGLRLGPGAEPLISGSGPAPLKKGQWKRAMHNADKSLQLLSGEVEMYNQWPGDLHLGHRADLLEVFWDGAAATSCFNYSLASRAETFGLSFVNLQGLELDKSSELLLQIVLQIKPRVLFVHRAANQPVQVKIAVQKCCELQVHHEGKFIVDFSSDFHEDASGVLLKIQELHDVCEVSFADNQYNEAGKRSFVTNCRCLLQAHETGDIAETMLCCIQNEVRMLCPWKFDEHVHEVWYAPPVDAPEEWLSLLESLEKRLGKSRYFYLSDDSKEMQQLRQLVPWELTRAQVYAQPVTRRMPADVPFTHRGAAMILNNGQLSIESEDLNEVRQPRLRFETPVRTAVFFYGIAEDDKAQQTAKGDTPDVHVPGLRTDISFPEMPDSIPKEVRSAVARLHINAGHPPRQELVRLLAAHGSINAAVLTALEHLKCGTCERARVPLKPRPASVPEFVGQFAEQLQADLFYVRDLSSTNHALLGVTCLATKLYQAAILESRDPQVVLNEFDRLWLRPYGYPLFMSVDADGAFEGVFQQHLQESGVLMNTVPADGHHQIGAIERRNAIFRSVLERLIDQNGVVNRDQMEMCISAAIWAVNTSIHTRFRVIFFQILQPLQLQITTSLLNNFVHKRVKLSRKWLHLQSYDGLYCAKRPGSMVAYWRWNLKARGRKRGGYILGRLVVKDDKNAWVQSGGSLVQVTHETQANYFEPVSGMMADKLDLLLTNLLSLLYMLPKNQNLTHNKFRNRQMLWHFLLLAGKLNLKQMRQQPVKGSVYSFAFDSKTTSDTTAYSKSTINATVTRNTTTACSSQKTPGSSARRAGNQDTNTFNTTSAGTSPTTASSVTASSHTGTFGVSHDDRPTSVPTTLEAPTVENQPETAGDGAAESMQATSTEEGPLPQVPAKRPHDALPASKLHNKKNKDYRATLLTNFILDNLFEIYGPDHSWDGSPEYKDGPPCLAFRCSAAKLEEVEVSSDSSDDEEGGRATTLSRQERKAIDREIPWRRIIADFPSNVVDLYVQANKKEFTSWTSWKSIRPVPPDEAQRIRADPVLRRRIMPSRNAYRDKNRGAGPDIKAKCRTVIQGCHDPDLGLLDRSSPTPTRLAEFLIYEIACAGYNRRLQRNRKSWKLWSGDVSTAFLQGQPQARDLPIFMRPPRDDIQRMAQTFLRDLYEVVGNLYGLCNAPRTWINHIVSKLVKANFKRHRLDHTVYYKLDDAGDLLVILLFHVDDFLVAFRQDYQFDELLNMFTWGQTNLLDDGEFVFKGKEVKLIQEKGEFRIKVTQKAFINELEQGKLPRGRADQGDTLTNEEFKEYRSCAGSLQWLGGTTRPDISATVSLSNLGQENGPQQLKMLYECIDYLKTTAEEGLTFYGVSLNYATTVIGYGDSSWANAPGGKSQMGVLVLLAGPECKDTITRATLVDWKSSRSPRVTRSTLASEANAMDECVDRCTFCNSFLSELLGGFKVTPEQLKTTGMLPQLQITDCKSLYDAVISDNPSTSEKRTTISIRSIQDYISPEQVHWVPTDLMHADVLTKHSTTLRDNFIKWLRNPTVQLKELVHRKEKDISVNVQLNCACIR